MGQNGRNRAFTIEIIEKEEAPDYTVDTLSLDVIAEVTELRPNAQDSENVNCGLLNRLPLGANRASPFEEGFKAQAEQSEAIP